MDAIAYTWTIDNFVNRTNKLIVSPRFTFSNHPQIEWRLQLYPFGAYNDETEMSLFLCKITDRFEPEVEYDLAIVGAAGQVKSKEISKTVFEFHDNQVVSGDFNFVTRNRVIHNLLVDGRLTIQVRNVQVTRVVELKDRLDATVFTWNIDNFLSQDAAELTSDKFIIPGHPLIKWQLICRQSFDRPASIKVNLRKFTDDCEIEFEYQLAIVCGDDEEKPETVTNLICFSDEKNIKAQSALYISRGQLIDDGYLIDGTLKIQVKVYRIVRIGYFDDYLSHRYNKEQLDLDSFKHYDFRVKTNGQTFEAHKFKLASKSPYFRNMFDSDLKENKENEVDLSQFQPEVIKEVVRFIYTGQLHNFDAISEQLIIAADYFQMDYLKILCQNNMTFRISLDNCLEFLRIADQANAPPLKEVAMRFLHKNKNCIHKQALRKFFNEQSDLAFEWVFWGSS